MIADSTWIERGRGDAGHASPPQPRMRTEAAGLEQDETACAVATLRDLAADTRRALDSAVARCERLVARAEETRVRLSEAQEALHARDADYASTIRALLLRLGELDEIQRQRDAAEARSRALERRFEHVVMKFPRRLARTLRARLTR